MVSKICSYRLFFSIRWWKLRIVVHPGYDFLSVRCLNDGPWFESQYKYFPLLDRLVITTVSAAESGARSPMDLSLYTRFTRLELFKSIRDISADKGTTVTVLI